MSQKPIEIAGRLRDWGILKYGTVNAFAEALKISQPQMSNYLNGRVVPGNKMQGKLRGLGCDIEWLMTGEKKGEGGQVAEAMALYNAAKELGITSAEELRKELSEGKAAKRGLTAEALAALLESANPPILRAGKQPVKYKLVKKSKS